MLRYWSVIGFLILLTSCNSSETGQTQETATIDPAAAFSQFGKNFKTVTLPYVVPNPDTSGKKGEISRELVTSLFSQKSFKPAFDEKDVPDLAENMESANYFYDAMWQTDGYQAFIIRKVEDDNYWYLATFDKEGKFIDGMCIAFHIGNEERTGVINDDQSIMIRQLEAGQGAGADGPTRLYEIAADGRIVPMKDNNVATHQPA